jgi:hypothetical protein
LRAFSVTLDFGIVLIFQFLLFVALLNPPSPKKNSCKILLLKKMGDLTTKLCDYTNVPNTQFVTKPITSPEITANSFEVSPG